MTLRLTLALCMAAAAAAVPALAHHSFAAEFDDKKPIKLVGKVTKVEFINPHCRWHGHQLGSGGRKPQRSLPARFHAGRAAGGFGNRRGWLPVQGRIQSRRGQGSHLYRRQTTLPGRLRSGSLRRRREKIEIELRAQLGSTSVDAPSGTNGSAAPPAEFALSALSMEKC